MEQRIELELGNASQEYKTEAKQSNSPWYILSECRCPIYRLILVYVGVLLSLSTGDYILCNCTWCLNMTIYVHQLQAPTPHCYIPFSIDICISKMQKLYSLLHAVANKSFAFSTVLSERNEITKILIHLN